MKGFTLLEVLISLFLMSLILCELDAAQIYSIREGRNAYLFSTAINQINNASERLAALKTHEGWDQEYMIWNRENEALLPSGFGTVNGDFPNYIITIYWGKISHHCEKTQIGPSGCLMKKIQLAQR